MTKVMDTVRVDAETFNALRLVHERHPNAFKRSPKGEREMMRAVVRGYLTSILMSMCWAPDASEFEKEIRNLDIMKQEQEQDQ